MHRSVAAGMAACSFLAGMALAAELEPEPASDIELETVLVVGEQPGPGLWKVTRGDHVLWILPRHDPLQMRMTWRTDHVEARIAESAEVLYPPEIQVEPSIGVFKVLSLVPAIPAALRAVKNPGGKTLREALPPATYARWQELRDKYFLQYNKKAKPEDLDEWRPSLAMMNLYGWAQSRAGLARGRVDRFVQGAAKKHKVPVNRPPAIRRAVKVEKDIRGMLKEAAVLPPEEIACFEQKLETLEADVELMKKRANAWATGNVAQLRELNRDYGPGEDCAVKTAMAITAQGSKKMTNARKMLESALWHEEQAQVQAQRDWLAAAQKALQKNRSTFAVLQVQDMLRAGGYVERLRALGYTVEEPL